MKKYKLKRKQEAHKKKNPTKFNRQQLLIKTTKQIVLEEFKRQEAGYWYRTVSDEKDTFGYELYHATRNKINIQYSDLESMWPIYTKSLEVLKENKKKAEFLDKKYVPLEEDLFSV